MMRGDATNNKWGSTKGPNKRGRCDNSQRCWQMGGVRETHLVGAFFSTQRGKGRVGKNANGTEYLCHLETKSGGAGRL